MFTCRSFRAIIRGSQNHALRHHFALAVGRERDRETGDLSSGVDRKFILIHRKLTPAPGETGERKKVIGKKESKRRRPLADGAVASRGIIYIYVETELIQN
jgi:hypothetical protein